MSWKLFFIVYLLGGLTFLPGLCALLVYIHLQLEKLKELAEKNARNELLCKDVDPNLKAGEVLDPIGVNVSKRGWITVTKEYYYHHTELQTPPIASETAKQDSNNTPPKDLNESQIPQRSQLRKRHKFYGVLKHGNLFLYKDDSPHSDLVHAISLQKSFVTMWPRDPKKEMSDSSLFTKRTCISILKTGLVSIDEEGKLVFNPSINAIQSGEEDGKQSSQQSSSNLSSNTYFLYFDNNSEKEDWYFKLIDSSKSNDEKNNNEDPLSPNTSAKTAHLNTRDMLYLIQSLNSTEGQLTTKWFNALIGRLFLALQQTNKLNEVLYAKIYKKLTNINKPGFLDDLVVKKVDVGTSAPMITHPELRELTPEGEMKIAMNLRYTGNISVIITTNIGINLGSHFKQREVSVQLSITLKELSGPLLIIMKPPPSNRIWYGFETDPYMNLDIEPMVSSSKISYNMVTNMIKGKFAEAIKESLVMPFMDDIVFYDTDHDVFRGGVWDRSEFSKPLLDMLRKQSSAEEKSIHSNDDIKEHETENNNKDDEREYEITKTSDTGILNKMGNVKNTLLNKANKQGSEESLEKSDDFNDTDSLTDSSIKPKKYIKNSIKKIGKWYKDNINSNDEEFDANINETEPEQRRVSLDSGKSVQSPTMISNRRMRGKRPEPPFIGAEPGSPTTVTTEKQTSQKSPIINATAMFANRNTELSVRGRSSISEGVNDEQAQPHGFIKMPTTNEFGGQLFEENIRTFNGSQVTSPQSTQGEFS